MSQQHAASGQGLNDANRVLQSTLPSLEYAQNEAANSFGYHPQIKDSEHSLVHQQPPRSSLAHSNPSPGMGSDQHRHHHIDQQEEASDVEAEADRQVNLVVYSSVKF